MVFAERHFELSDSSPVVVRFSEPVADRGDYRCDYVITGLDRIHKSHAFGVDGVQALYLAMELAHVDLLASKQAKAGELRWMGQRDLGLPLPASVNADDFK